MSKLFRSLFSFCFVLLLIFGMFLPAFAAASAPSLTISQAHALYTNDSPQATASGVSSCTITDPDVIQALANSGAIMPDEHGNLPTSVTIELYSMANALHSEQCSFEHGAPCPLDFVTLPAQGKEITITETEMAPWCADVPISQDVFMDGDTLSATFTGSASASWTTSMTTSVEVKGYTYGITDLKDAVSAHLGISTGSTVTVSKTFSSTAPEGMCRILSVYVSYSGFLYTGKVGGVPLGTGQASKPIGLYAVHADYPIVIV